MLKTALVSLPLALLACDHDLIEGEPVIHIINPHGESQQADAGVESDAGAASAMSAAFAAPGAPAPKIPAPPAADPGDPFGIGGDPVDPYATEVPKCGLALQRAPRASSPRDGSPDAPSFGGAPNAGVPKEQLQANGCPKGMPECNTYID